MGVEDIIVREKVKLTNSSLSLNISVMLIVVLLLSHDDVA